MQGHSYLPRILLLALLTACGGSEPPPPNPPQQIVLSPPESRLPRPDTLPEIVSVVTDTAEVPVRRGFGDAVESTPVAFTFRIGRGPEPGRLRLTTTLVDLGAPLTGPGPRHRELVLDMCPFSLQVYRSASREGEPTWDSWRRLTTLNSISLASPSEPRIVFGCPSVNPVLRLPPGDSVPGRVLHWSGHVMDVLGDSLPEGRYYLQAEIRFPESRGDTLRLPAGSVDLRRVPRTGG